MDGAWDEGRRRMTILPGRLSGAPAAPRKLGEMLVSRGALAAAELSGALVLQRASGARLGDVLVAHGLAAPSEVAAALGDQRGLQAADLAADPPDPALIAAAALAAMAGWRALPWKREADGALTFVTPEPDRLLADPAALRRAFRLRPQEPVNVALCAHEDWERAFLRIDPDRRARRAARRTPDRLSARRLCGTRARLAVLGVLTGVAVAVAAAPGPALWALMILALALNAVNVTLRATYLSLRPPAPVAPPPAVSADDRPLSGTLATAAADALLPPVTLMIALYREPQVIPGLVAALKALDYPAERLEVIFATEADDAATHAALAAAAPPPWMRAIPTPAGGPRTKPRALNHALDFARGTIVGIYDAEDRPEPRQVRAAVEAFARAAPRVACVQARLGFRNAEQSWLTRCFAIEYATWFRVILPGMRRLGFPLPLAGTSLFLRRRALERLGAWDAWNVTEDADLGMRLARAGYETELINSETAEEAVARPLAWIRQRSRWQKGYLHTWLVHMRSPSRLRRDLGGWRFLGMQLHFLGAATSFLSQPLLWFCWVAWLSGGSPFGLDFGSWPLAGLILALHLGQAVVLGASVVALKRARLLRLAPFAPMQLLYWPLATFSALKGLAEAVVAPAWWDKTRHHAFDGGQGKAASVRAGAGPAVRPVSTAVSSEADPAEALASVASAPAAAAAPAVAGPVASPESDPGFAPDADPVPAARGA